MAKRKNAEKSERNKQGMPPESAGPVADLASRMWSFTDRSTVDDSAVAMSLIRLVATGQVKGVWGATRRECEKVVDDDLSLMLLALSVCDQVWEWE
jgi:hypothetical protein